MRWRYLLFDLDGTLTDPMLGITRSVQYALHRFGIEVDDLRTLCRFIGPPLKESFRDFYGMDDEQATRAVALTREYFAPRGIFENRLYEGIPELLTELQAAGCMLAMATSKPEPFARQIAEHFRLADRFTLIGGATMDGTRTAKRDVVRYVLGALDVEDPTAAVMIGDRRYDIEGAAAEGIASIGVLWGYGSREELAAAGVGQIVGTIPELRALLL